MDRQFIVLYCRRHVTEKNKILICGHWRERESRDTKLVVTMDYTPVPFEIERPERIMTGGVYGLNSEYKEHLFLWVTLPDDYRTYKKLRLFEQREFKLKEVFSQKTEILVKLSEYVYMNIDDIKQGNEGMFIRGWCIAKEDFEVRALDKNGNPIAGKIKEQPRPDVKRTFPECEPECIHGFTVQTEMAEIGDVKITCDGVTVSLNDYASESLLKKGYGKIHGFSEKVRSYYRQFGLKRTVKRACEKLTHKEITTYEQFRRAYEPTVRQLEKQREKIFDYQPQFSIVVPLYQTPVNCLEALIQSVKDQTYSNWKLYLSDGSGENSPIASVIKEYERKNDKICVIQNHQRLQIAENTNKALERADGDFIVFVDHDDMLAPNALYECVKVLNHLPDTELIYTDEDKVSMNGKEYYYPHFKSDFNLDLLRSQNYINHLCVVRKTLFEKVGYLRPEYNGSQDYDFILRCIEKTDRIVHIPKVLYHWRTHPNSVAGDPESKNYAYCMAKKALEEHYKRVGIEADIVEVQQGVYRSIYHMKEEPLVSIIIPNKDHVNDLRRCIDSVQRDSTYRNFEILIVENNSETEEIKNYYREVTAQYENVRVLEYQKEFNYSAIHNYAVAKTNGEYILLLNNDTWIQEKDSIREMVSYCMRDDVGIVGSRLYYPDDFIQHAGVIVGFGGVAGHAFLGLYKDETGYFNRVICTQDYSAVTAACMMVKKSIYEEVGGMETELQVAFNDTDFCMRVREKGYLVVYHPFSVWYHDESKTRGLDDSGEKLKRFQQEIDFFQRRWGTFLEHGDPYYNPNLTLGKHDFSLKS